MDERIIRELDVFREGIRSQTKESIKNKIKEIDSRKWREDLDEKSSVTIYKEWRKENGGQEEVYTNDPASEILFKCRSNTLRLNYINIFINKSTECFMCGAECEDLEHFLLWCPAYREERHKHIKLQQPYQN